MTDDIFSWVVTLVGCFGFWLGGRKVWWCWYVNIANQLLWFAFAIITGYYAFLVGGLFYLTVFSRNAYLWTREHFDEKRSLERVKEAWGQKKNDPPIVLPPYIATCGNVCRLEKTSPWTCIRPSGHEGAHSYGGMFWDNKYGSPSLPVRIFSSSYDERLRPKE